MGHGDGAGGGSGVVRRSVAGCAPRQALDHEDLVMGWRLVAKAEVECDADGCSVRADTVAHGYTDDVGVARYFDAAAPAGWKSVVVVADKRLVRFFCPTHAAAGGHR